MKNLRLLILLAFTLVVPALVFTACDNDDDEPTNFAQNIVGTYKGDIKIKVGDLPETTELQKIVLHSNVFNAVTMTLNDFTYSVPGTTVNLGNIVVNNIPVEPEANNKINILKTTSKLSLVVGEVDVTVEGVVTGNNLKLTIGVVADASLGLGNINVSFDGTKMASDNESTAAQITKMTFEEEIVVVQPEINGTSIVFYVDETATDEDLKALVPIITISDKATITPESGVAQDFSNGAVVDYTVVAEDGIHKTTYKVTAKVLLLADKLIGSWDYTEYEMTGLPSITGVDVEKIVGGILEESFPYEEGSVLTFNADGKATLVNPTADDQSGEYTVKDSAVTFMGMTYNVEIVDDTLYLQISNETIKNLIISDPDTPSFIIGIIDGLLKDFSFKLIFTKA